MRPLRNIMAILFLIATGMYPVYSQDQGLVAMDERPDTDFEEYETYNWTTEAGGTSTLYTLNDLVLKNTIRDAIQYELDARGYEMGGANADLLINFKVFEAPTEIQGFTEAPEDIGTDEVRDPESAKTYEVEEGTLLIQILDKSEGTVVWQGYASGIMDGDVFDRSPERIKDAVQKIFNQYEHSAK